MSESASFPPGTIEAFLRCCDGDWMSLRSRFELGPELESGDGDEWHSSERGELRITYLEPSAPGSAGGLQVGCGEAPPSRLAFEGDGRFQAGPHQGVWTLWPDGSLELVIDRGESELRERIWFTKPNLRLRSTVLQHKNGNPGQASFSSEIRRVSRPAATTS